MRGAFSSPAFPSFPSNSLVVTEPSFVFPAPPTPPPHHPTTNRYSSLFGKVQKANEAMIGHFLTSFCFSTSPFQNAPPHVNRLRARTCSCQPVRGGRPRFGYISRAQERGSPAATYVRGAGRTFPPEGPGMRDMVQTGTVGELPLLSPLESLSPSLSLSGTHTHTHTYTQCMSEQWWPPCQGSSTHALDCSYSI